MFELSCRSSARPPDAAVRIQACQSDHRRLGGEAVPPIERRRSIEQRSPAPGRAGRNNRAAARHSRSRALVAPFAVGVQPLDAVDRRVGDPSSAAPASASPGAPRSPKPPSRRRPRRPHAAAPPSGYGDARHVERDVVAIVGADFDGVEAQHAVEYTGGSGGRVASPWSVRMTNRRPARAAAPAIAGLSPCAVGSRGVDVIGAGDRARGRDRPTRGSSRRGSARAGRRRRTRRTRQSAGRGRARPAILGQTSSLHQRPASALSAAALSVRSQVNSGSVRPKWPNAAVFL